MPKLEYILFFAAFGAFVVIFLYRLIKHGGLRGAMYGSAVARTVGEVMLVKTGGTTKKLRVLLLENEQVVLELSARTLLAGSFQGFPMSTDNTDELIALLQQARR